MIQQKYINPLFAKAIKLIESNSIEEALVIIEKLKLKYPKNLIYLFQSAINYAKIGDFENSLINFQKLDEISPNTDWILNNYAVVLMHFGDYKNAELKLKKSLELNSENNDSKYNLINLLNIQERPNESIKLLNLIFKSDPKNHKAYSLLGATLFKLSDFSASKIAYEVALTFKEDFTEAKFNLANLEYLSGNFQKSITLYEDLLLISNDSDINETPSETIKFSLSMAYLANGQLELGWLYYDYGFSLKTPSNIRRSPNRSFACPRWNGTIIKTARLLVWGEQGIGDEIIFMTCLAELKSLDMHIIIECQERLVPLVTRSFPMFKVRPSAFYNQVGLPPVYTDYDFHIPMGSLLGIYRDSFEKFSSSQPYIIVNTSLALKFEERLKESCVNRLRVGICWKSGLLNSDRNLNYTNLIDWEVILKNPCCDFINLQYGNHEEEIILVEKKLGIKIIRWEDLNLKDDFDSTTSLMSRLDLIISVGSAVFSMGAAVGLPVILMMQRGWDNFGTNSYPMFPNIQCLFPLKGQTVAHCIEEASKIISDHY
jgi:tetratricopeptide (TPR) repeat protein